MRLLVLFVTALIVTFVTSQPTIKSDWSQVNTKPSTLENEGYFVSPRAASFSDGRYIVVYTIVTDLSDSIAVGQIFYPNGSIALAEFQLATDLVPEAFISAPNVVVFDDDTFLVVYRWDNAGDPTAMILAKRYNVDAKPAGNPFQVDNPPISFQLNDGVELIGFADKSFGIVYYSSSTACSTAVYYGPQDNFLTNLCIQPTEGTAAASIVGDSSRTMSYLVSETGNTDITVGQITMEGDISTQTLGLGFVLSNPVVALSGDRYITYVFSNGDAMHYAVAEVGSVLNSNVLFSLSDTIAYSSPAAIGLNETTVFLGYRYTETSQPYLAYQLASLVPRVEFVELIPDSSSLSVQSTVNALQFVPLRGSDLLVIGKNSSDGGIVRQILTFCGNGHIELDEECDGTANCDTECRCTNGLIGYNGICGLPNVIPVLDCVQVVANGYNLHFSFINEDGVVQNMEHGYKNYFSPSNVATDRPTRFDLGSTLTYPVSPYTTFVGSGVSSINWVLGSYNLTVDLTNIEAFRCPDYIGFIADVTTPAYIYDSGSTLAENFAARYNLSPYRLESTAVQTGGSLPVDLKRASSGYRYDITVAVGPGNETNAQELKSAEAVKSVIEDFKKNSTEVKEDLLSGYAPDSDIKEITPTPTEVEVRGTRFDSSNVKPPTSAPTTQTTPSGTTPTTVNTPQTTSGALVVIPSFLATILYSLLA